MNRANDMDSVVRLLAYLGLITTATAATAFEWRRRRLRRQLRTKMM